MIAASMAAVVDDLTAGGLSAVADPAAVDPPCALVDPPTLTDPSAGGTWLATYRVHLIAPGGVGGADAVVSLDELLTRALAVVDVTEIRPSTITLGSTGDPVPALTLTIERTAP